MQITAGDIRLVTLTEDKIELVRNWRNSPDVNEYLLNRRKISREEQAAWFKRTIDSNNHYLIIQYKGTDIGLIYTSRRDPEMKSVETNILIGEEPHRNSGIALKACLLFTNFLLEEDNRLILFSTVNKKNTNALGLDCYLGFKPYKEDKKLIFLQLTHDDFMNSKGYGQLNKLMAAKQGSETSDKHLQ